MKSRLHEFLILCHVSPCCGSLFGGALPAKGIYTPALALFMPQKGFLTEEHRHILEVLPKCLCWAWTNCTTTSFGRAVKLRNPLSRNILFGMAYGCDGSRVPHMTGLQSAMLRSRQLWRLTHGYGFEGGFCLFADLKLSLRFHIRWDAVHFSFISIYTILSRHSLPYTSTLQPSKSVLLWLVSRVTVSHKSILCLPQPL